MMRVKTETTALQIQYTHQINWNAKEHCRFLVLVAACYIFFSSCFTLARCFSVTLFFFCTHLPSVLLMFEVYRIRKSKNVIVGVTPFHSFSLVFFFHPIFHIHVCNQENGVRSQVTALHYLFFFQIYVYL